MQQIDITQRVQFTCDYLVQVPAGYKIQPCLYTVDVTVRSTTDSDDRLLDFETLRDGIAAVVPSGKFIVSLTDNHVKPIVDALESFNVPIERVSFKVSAENLCRWIASMLQGRLYFEQPNICVTEVVLNENGTSTARWRKWQ